MEFIEVGAINYITVLSFAQAFEHVASRHRYDRGSAMLALNLNVYFVPPKSTGVDIPSKISPP